MKIKQFQESFSRYIFLFLFFCMIGWIYEVILAIIYGHGFVNRGFLYGPYLPLYGSGALLLILFLHRLMKQDIRIRRMRITPLVIFAAIILITTALEYVVGLFLETVFHQRFWDYSTYNWQFQGRICVSASVRFGLGGMFFLYVLVPLFTKMINKIPARFRFVLSLIIVILLAADLILTLYFSSLYGFDPVLAQPK
ncbi:MAG: putative ABC transporter permease [Lachnospiraceae bacterium]